jgi:murein DD-endopeptidase MepM/ murein hydrolase activator NlpD
MATPAAALELSGQIAQGGLVVAKAAPGAGVVLDGRKLRVGPDGRFVFGFGRDHRRHVTLTVAGPNGETVRKTLEVKQRDYEIQRIDGLPEKMVTPPQDVLERIRRENRAIARARANDRGAADFLNGWIWPAEGPITGVYGSQRVLNGEPRRPHYGIDIAAPAGSPVVAPADGVVTLAETDLYYTGGTIILDHGHGVTSAFLHMRALNVETGDAVKLGERIGTVGSTGRSTGAHLDWRVNWFDERIDPRFLAGEMK